MIQRLAILTITAASLAFSPLSYAVKGKEPSPDSRRREQVKKGQEGLRTQEAKDLRPTQSGAGAAAKAMTDLGQARDRIRALSNYPEVRDKAIRLIMDGQIPADQVDRFVRLMELADETKTRLNVRTSDEVDSLANELALRMSLPNTDEGRTATFLKIVNREQTVDEVPTARDQLLLLALDKTIQQMSGVPGYLDKLDALPNGKITLDDFARTYAELMERLLGCKRV